MVRPQKSSTTNDYPQTLDTRQRGLFASLGWPYCITLRDARLLQGELYGSYPN